MPRAGTPYQDTQAWRDERRTGYGASDAPVLIEGDEAAWRQLHGEKLGLLPDRDGSETMELGKRLEDIIARVAGERNGWRLQRVNRLVRHPELPFVFASLDRRIVGSPRPLEVKKYGWKNEQWGPAGSDIVPVRILYQVQQQAAVTGADAVELVVLFGGAKIERFTVGRDASMIDEILGLEAAAWAYVERGEMPPWPGPAPKRIVLSADEVPVDDVLRSLVLAHEAADASYRAAEAERKEAKDRLREALADAGAARGVLEDGRRVSISHRPQEPAATVEWALVAAAYRKWIEALERDHGPWAAGVEPPDLDALESMFTTTAKPRRDLRVTVGKETPANGR